MPVGRTMQEQLSSHEAHEKKQIMLKVIG